MGVPDDLAATALARVRGGEPPREVAEELRRELQRRALPSGLLGWLLADM
jgi:hypothetical protein